MRKRRSCNPLELSAPQSWQFAVAPYIRGAITKLSVSYCRNARIVLCRVNPGLQIACENSSQKVKIILVISLTQSNVGHVFIFLQLQIEDNL